MNLQRLSLLLSGVTAARTAFSFLTYVLAARRFGAGLELDLFFLATTPFLAMVNITEAAGIGAAITFHNRLVERTDAERRAALGGLFMGLTAATLGLGLAVFLSAPHLARVLAPGLTANAVDRVTLMLKLCAFGIVFAPVGLICGVGILRAQRRFFTAAALPFVPTLLPAIALFTVVTRPEHLVAALVLGHVAAGLLGIATTLPSMALRWHRPSPSLILDFLRDGVPLFVAELSLQGIWIRERQLASTLGAGSVSALALALRIVAVAGTTLANGIEHTSLPTISGLHFAGQEREALSQARAALRFASALALAAGAILFLWPEVWVSLAFQRGAFGQMDTMLTASAAACYVGVFVFNAIGRVVMAATIGLGQARVAAPLNFLILVTYLILSPWFVSSGGYAGLALAASTSLIAGTCCLLLFGIRTR